LAIETIIIWFLYPETKGPTLEELGRLFGDETVVNNKLDPEKAHDRRKKSKSRTESHVSQQLLTPI
jgi:hypothetical protein